MSFIFSRGSVTYSEWFWFLLHTSITLSTCWLHSSWPAGYFSTIIHWQITLFSIPSPISVSRSGFRCFPISREISNVWCRMTYAFHGLSPWFMLRMKSKIMNPPWTNVITTIIITLTPRTLVYVNINNDKLWYEMNFRLSHFFSNLVLWFTRFKFSSTEGMRNSIFSDHRQSAISKRMV